MEELYKRAYKMEAELRAKGKEPHGFLREVLIDAMLDGYDVDTSEYNKDTDR